MGHTRRPDQLGKDAEKARNAQFLTDLIKTGQVGIGEVLHVFDILSVFSKDEPPAGESKTASLFKRMNAHQWTMHKADPKPIGTQNATKLMECPIPDGVGTLGLLLTQNTVSFGELEDLIAEDPMVVDLRPRLNSGPQTIKLLAAEALRARRVTIAALAELGLSYAQPQGIPTQIQTQVSK